MGAADAGPSAGRVLVLDDDDQVREMLCVALEVVGFETVDVDSTCAAYRRLVSGSPLDALIIGLTEGEFHGVDVLRFGADAFFVKPLSMRDLQTSLGALVSEVRPTVLRR